MKKFLSTKLGFFSIVVFLFWIKTYIIYNVEFNLGVSNSIQQFLLFFNPLSSALIFIGLALFFKGRKAGYWMITIDFIMTFILFANVVYYRANSDFITLPMLMQTSNFGSLGGSIVDSMAWFDIFYALDLVLVIILFMKVKSNWSAERMQLRKPAIVLLTGIVAFSINLGLAEADRPELLKRTFDRNYLVKYLGTFNFTIYDTVESLKSSTQRVMADSTDMEDIEDYTKDKYAEPNEDYFGKAEGKNIIKIHLESLQSFLIDYELDGEEVTPFLNSLVNEDDTDFTYFDNFFHQTGQGKTADAELIMDNSIFGLPQGAAFSIKGNNTYQSLPSILDQEKGYTNSVMHGDNKSFWNRDEAYKEMGIDEFYDSSYYDMSEDRIINYGLKDKPFFEDSMSMLESQEEPFYSHLITLTNHHPYLIDDEDATIDPAETGDASVDTYFQTARYLDEALEDFFEDLKEQGLYDDSFILLYGDHYGISDEHNNAMEEITGDEITPQKNAELQRVPLMMKIPGVEGQGTNHEYSGEMDVMPTLLHLAGVENADDYIQFGTDLFSDEHKDFVPFRNGDFMTKDFSRVNGTFYDNETEEVIDEPTDEMKELREKVMSELEMSDDILQGDLLRFHEPNDEWEPEDTSDYVYGKKENEKQDEDGDNEEDEDDDNEEDEDDNDDEDANNDD